MSFSNPDYRYVLVWKGRSSNPNEVWMTGDAGKNWRNITPDDAVAQKYGFPDIAINDIILKKFILA